MLKAANTDGKEEMKVSNGFHLDSKEPDWSKLLTASNLEKRCSQPKHRDMATPTLLHFGSAQARPFAIIDGLFKVLPALFGTALNFRSSHHGRGALLPKAANTAEI